MPKNNFTHLSSKERYLIFVFHTYHKWSARKIAKACGRHHSTISHELERNSLSKEYNDRWAH